MYFQSGRSIEIHKPQSLSSYSAPSPLDGVGLSVSIRGTETDPTPTLN
jgi:hypothetical protein